METLLQRLQIEDSFKLQETKECFTDIYELREKIQELKQFLLQNDKHINTFGNPHLHIIMFLELKSRIMSIEDTLTELKRIQIQELHPLSSKQEMLEQEIQLLNDRMAFDEQQCVVGLDSHSLYIQDIQENQYEYLLSHVSVFQSKNQPTLPKEIQEYQEFMLKRGGQYGFWDEPSHTEFLKLRLRYGANNPRFFTVCAQKIPGITLEMAQNHEKWYREFKKMESLKKDAISKWKKEKQMQSEILLKDMEKENENKKQENTHKMMQTDSKRNEIQQKIREWKEKKKLESVKNEKDIPLEDLEKQRKQKQNRVLFFIDY